MYAIGNNELMRKRPAGKYTVCPHCGKRRIIKHGKLINKDGTRSESKVLGFVNCKNKSYMVSLMGKLI